MRKRPRTAETVNDTELLQPTDSGHTREPCGEWQTSVRDKRHRPKLALRQTLCETSQQVYTVPKATRKPPASREVPPWVREAQQGIRTHRGRSSSNGPGRAPASISSPILSRSGARCTPSSRASSTACVTGEAAQPSIWASTVASLMSTALLAVSRVRFRSFARVRRCASASARSGWVSSSR